MDRIESAIVVDAAPNVCYSKWHHFEQFPHFMKNVEEVRRTGDKSWHWVVNGPLGHRTEWDAEIDGDELNQLISWHSLTGSEVTVAGAVHFKDLGQNKTEVRCQIQYQPPAGALGEVVANLLANPEQMVRKDLENFKHLVEGTNVPVEKAHQGRVMQPDPFVVPPSPGNSNIHSGISPSTETAGKDFVSTPPTPRVDEEGYELIYGLEDDLPVVGSSSELAREDIIEIQLLGEEEAPYLGAEGALYTEDLIDMRNHSPLIVESIDIYTESMDISEEDLNNFTEDLDDEIDIGSASKDSMEAFTERGNSAGSGLGPREEASEVSGADSAESQAPVNAPTTERGSS
jgi:hypothetical protein